MAALPPVHASLSEVLLTTNARRIVVRGGRQSGRTSHVLGSVAAYLGEERQDSRDMMLRVGLDNLGDLKTLAEGGVASIATYDRTYFRETDRGQTTTADRVIVIDDADDLFRTSRACVTAILKFLQAIADGRLRLRAVVVLDTSSPRLSAAQKRILAPECCDAQVRVGSVSTALAPDGPEAVLLQIAKTGRAPTGDELARLALARVDVDAVLLGKRPRRLNDAIARDVTEHMLCASIIEHGGANVFTDEVASSIAWTVRVLAALQGLQAHQLRNMK